MGTLNRLKKWLGIKDTLKMFERDERGIYTTEPIKEGNIVIKIKSKYLLEYQQIYQIYTIDDIEEANSLVAFYLTKLYLDKDEFWSPYINTLPENLKEFPYYWNVQELNYLKSTSFYSGVEINYPAHLETIQTDFDIIYQYNTVNSIIENCSKDELWNIYIRFRILVGSRIFGYLKYGIETSGMVPYIDLLNHSGDQNTIWYWDDKLDAFILMATRNINKGEEITDNYGLKTNIELLLYYGFTINPNSSSTLSFNLNDINYTFSLQYDLMKLEQLETKYKCELKKKLEKIYSNHKNKISNIKNTNIQNIYKDEMNIIKLLLVNL